MEMLFKKSKMLLLMIFLSLSICNSNKLNKLVLPELEMVELDSQKLIQIKGVGEDGVEIPMNEESFDPSLINLNY